MYVCLLLPAYNEAKTIDRIIREASEFVHDILVIDDGSIDQTAQIAEKAGGKVIKHSTNLGKGMALRTGFDYISQKDYDLIATMDSDGQHDSGRNIVQKLVAQMVGFQERAPEPKVRLEKTAINKNKTYR